MLNCIIIGMLFLLGGEKSLISRNEFQQVITNYVERSIDTTASDALLEFRSLPESIVIEKSEYSLSVAPAVLLPNKGYAGIPVEIRSNGKLIRTVMCSVIIRRFEDVCVTTRSLEKNELIQPIDITVQRMETTALDNEVIASVIAAVNTRAKRMLKANTILKSTMIEEIPAVNYNDNVVVIVRSNNLSIASSGVAREEGKIGDEVRVQRTGTREYLSGKVIGKQTVEIVVR